MKLARILLAVLCLVTGASAFSAGAVDKQTGSAPGGVVVLTMTGAIGPALYNYMQKGFAEAEHKKAAVILIELKRPAAF
jgi:membrane-bound ClpP family serine protease